MRAVNLLPVDESRAARGGLRGPVLAALAGALAVAAAVGVVATAEGTSLRSKQDELVVVRAQLAATPPVHAPAWEGRVQKAETKRTTALAAALGQRVGWERIARELAAVLPPGVFLTRVDGHAAAASDSAAAAPPGTSAGSALTIDGVTSSHAAVADLLSRLEAVPDFAGVSLESSLTAVAPAPPGVSFRVGLTLRQPEAAP